MASRSLWNRFVRLFRSKAGRALDRYETPEDLAEQAMQKHKSNMEKFNNSLVESLANLRIQQSEYKKQIREHDELRLKVEAAAKKVQSLKAKGGSEEEIGRYVEYINSLVEQIRAKEQVIQDLKPALDALSARIEELKKRYKDAERESARITQERNLLLLRSSSAQGLERAVEISSSMEGSLEFGGVNKELQDRVALEEGRAAARLEIAADSNASKHREIEREIAASTVSSDVENLLATGRLTSKLDPSVRQIAS